MFPAGDKRRDLVMSVLDHRKVNRFELKFAPFEEIPSTRQDPLCAELRRPLVSADPRLRRDQARDAAQHRRQVVLLAGGESSYLIMILGRAALSLGIRSNRSAGYTKLI